MGGDGGTRGFSFFFFPFFPLIPTNLLFLHVHSHAQGAQYLYSQRLSHKELSWSLLFYFFPHLCFFISYTVLHLVYTKLACDQTVCFESVA